MAFDLLCTSVMIRMSLQIQPPPARLAEILSAFRLISSRTTVQPGCIESSVSADERGNGVVIYQEDWESWDPLEMHIRSDSFLNILQLMESSISTPVLQFVGPNKVCGMELIETLRQKSKTNSGA
jgi:quinol monooxygenase YgiN